ncbi:hypothetical protein PCAR4_200085 [Paraburkholderia caribensis]|nr:hypothetical protein PCAR4_200085 [Paraburkholderia caribensis]
MKLVSCVTVEWVQQNFSNIELLGEWYFNDPRVWPSSVGGSLCGTSRDAGEGQKTGQHLKESMK